MKKWKKNLLIVSLGLLTVLVLGPLFIPIPPLDGTRPVTALADPDSRFVNVSGLSVHYKEMGTGEPVLILLHGFGASTFSWREVMEPMSDWGRVIAFDRPAFGLTERPLPEDSTPEEWERENPYTPEAQVAIVTGLMDALGIERAVLVGSSAGGTVALHTALTHPQRVDALVLVDAAVYIGGGAPSWVRPLLNTPQIQHLGPLIARQLEARGDDFIRLSWHDPSRVTAEILAGYRKPLMAENWDRALWQLTSASGGPDLADRLSELDMPVLVLTGDDDRIVPTEQSIRLAQDIPGAALVVFENTGHLPHEESPEVFLEAVQSFTRSR